MRHHAITALLGIFVAACAADDSEPHQVQPASSDPNFVLYVTNKGSEAVDIDIRIDAELAVTGKFPVDTEYSFDFELGPGGHSINPVSDDAGAQRVDLFNIRGGVVYGVCEFVKSRPETGQPGFTWQLSDSPPTFEGSAEGAKR
jgi:hypothetical protein